MPFRSRSTEGTDEPPPDEDTEGHRRLFKAGDGTDQPPSDEATDDADAEGHVFKVKGAADDKSETERGIYRRADESPND